MWTGGLSTRLTLFSLCHDGESPHVDGGVDPTSVTTSECVFGWSSGRPHRKNRVFSIRRMKRFDRKIGRLINFVLIRVFYRLSNLLVNTIFLLIEQFLLKMDF